MTLLATIADTGASATSEVVLFWVFASIALGSGIAMITMRNIVHAALMLVLNFLCIAGLYLGLQSSFLSIVQIIVYAGAIVVLFLFVIMLLGVDGDDLLGTKNRAYTVGAVMVGVLFAGAFLAVLGADSLTDASACGSLAVVEAGDAGALPCVGMDAAIAEQGDSITVVADQLFTRWTYPFELAALLLVVATLGALVLGRRQDPALTEDDLVDLEAEEAFAELAAEHQAANVTDAEGDPVDAMSAAAAAAVVVEEDHFHGGYGHGDHTGHDHSMLPDESPDATPDATPDAAADPTDEDA